MSFRDLHIWQDAQNLVVVVFEFSSEYVPSNHQFEIGSQIRRSVVSVKSNIVEGYGRRRYKKDYLKFLIYAMASLDETVDHVETIKGVYPKSVEESDRIIGKCTILGKKLNNFTKAIDRRKY